MKERSLEEIIQEEIKKASAEETKVNIYITGATGVGKSSFINAIFEEDVAETGVGAPVTQKTKKYDSQKSPFVLFDTKGYELGSRQHEEYVREMKKYMTDKVKPEEQIHLVWYFISATSSRVTDKDIELIKELQSTKRPVCVVLTKCDMVDIDEIEQMKKELEKQGITSFETSAHDIRDEDFEAIKLIHWSAGKMEGAIKEAFIRSQKVDLELLKESVDEKIYQHATGSFFIAFTPIPFSDGPVLIANQSSMVIRIFRAYGLDATSNQIVEVLKGLGVGKIIRKSGSYIAGQLLKLIPGAGTISAGLINGTVASTITLALGYTFSEIAYDIKKKNVESPDALVSDIMDNLLQAREIQDIFQKKYQDVK